MRLHWCLAVLLFLVGCASHRNPPTGQELDSIDRVVQRLASEGSWETGEYPVIFLPATASIEEVVTVVLEVHGIVDFPWKIMETRQVHLGKQPYTAALVQTRFGRKVVLLRYLARTGWWTRLHDAPDS